MFRALALIILGCSLTCLCFAQKGRDPFSVDTSFVDYDELISELDHLIDSLTSPRSYTVANVNLGPSFLAYENEKNLSETNRRLVYTPSLAYFNKAGYGISAGASVVNDGTRLNPYQFSLTGSFDFQQHKDFLAGVSLTHYLTKKDLPFYTSPLQNEAYAYLSYRRFWLKPSVAFSYGWGNRDNYEEVEEKIRNINLAQKGFTRINTVEKIIDLNLVASVRHDFYWLDALGSNYIRLTPQLSFTSGSQQFGFNQTSNTYATVRRTGRSILYNTENFTFDNKVHFQPLSLTAFLKVEYAKGKFFVQPQLVTDYYFPAASANLTTAFQLNAGLVF